MRRPSALKLTALVAAVGLASALTPLAAAAQQRPGTNPSDQGVQDEARKQRLDREMQTQALPLPPVMTEGPCPYVKVLYDAARFVEFKNYQEASSAVMWSGEIEGVLADCTYLNADPIKVWTNITFRFGKGPQAPANGRTFRYWVAVTDRNRTVLSKEYFDIGINFGNQDRIQVIEQVKGISIPRASKTVSGANFEVLIGFDVTPQQVAFNRSGARFRVNATGETAAADATTGAPTAP